ncbi:TetR/AcrR family transcriptional regulator [Streptomyces lavendofoliae]|uniref:TetR family transcriptional regulator n=1 Tax=Streptomyces lavendofoliae TaxID=67314 RepID=A0A918HWK1_9ACTN|nr:TetR family transcriptional regulator [Streptomyces lavendofoliae]GGU36613.1 TetR family transcriptional regulator [Streptomyces lavendofoliae]
MPADSLAPLDPLGPLAAARRPMGLRERKKLKTRVAIRRATHRLIADQGYEATTVEQIAEAAEVSPSTVFRYFPAKEDIVLTDEYGPVMADALRERPAGEEPLESLRSVLTRTAAALLAHEPEETRRRARLMAEVPAVRARAGVTTAGTSRLLAGVLADRTGRGADDLQVRVLTAAALGAFGEAMAYWAEHDQRDDLVALVHRTLDALGGGLTG